MRVLNSALLAGLVLAVAASDVRSAEVRPDHPRMLINADGLPALRNRCRGADKAIFEAFLARLNQVMDETPKGDWHFASYPGALGFAYLITGEEKYVRPGVAWLRAMLTYHLQKVKNGGVGTGEGGAANWETTMLRRDNYVAYDWLSNGMTLAERKELGKLILAISDIHKERETWNHAYAGGYNRFENDILAGLAVARSDVDDTKAAEYVRSGHDFYMTQTIAARNQVASDDGGVAAGMGYAFYNYIPVEAYFLKCWLTATGEDLRPLDNSIKNFGAWTLYCATPDQRFAPFCDVTTPRPKLGRRALMMATSLYNDGRAAWLAPPFSDRYILGSGPDELIWTDPSVTPLPPDDRLPKARHFQGLGWVAMRSDWTPGATWALFTSGNRYYGHTHFDQNHFVIYKHELLASDAMERVWTTLGHNTLLIFDDDDGTQTRGGGTSMVRYLEKVPEDQRRGEITRFETNDAYTYTCGDASRAYGGKATEYTRQFVFLQPDTFVVFDRVTSAKPNARKVWQLHADTEPAITGTTSTITGDQGKLTCVTLLPPSPRIEKELQHLEGSQGTHADLWDITVEPARTSQSQRFLHVLCVGGKGDAAFPTAELIKEVGSVGARISSGETMWTVTFTTEGPPAGYIRRDRTGSPVLDRPLTDGIQAQAGYGLDTE